MVGAVRLWPVVAVLAASTCRADFLTPERAGFRHCALVYERASRSVEDLLPYVAHVRDGRPREWLFDCFLFLRFGMPSGMRTDEGPTTWPDWQRQLDDWFDESRDLRSLDEAVARAAIVLGAPPARRKVMLSIPYPNPTTRDFGLGGAAGPGSLDTIEGLERAARYYVGEAGRRFRNARYRNLDLWGFYWMREEIGPTDEARVAAATRVVHSAGYRMSWIPWWRAQGWNRGRGFGIDAVFLQPNYAFVSWTHRGAVRRNRLAAAADLAAAHGVGLEIEAGDIVSSRADRSAFLHYLAEGSQRRLGYGAGACAYYLGVDTVERTSRSSDTELRRLYDSLADFVRGRTVADPDPPQAWKLIGGGYEGRLPAPAYVTNLDILFDDEPGAGVWKGRVEVWARSRAGGKAEPAGWAVRTTADPSSGRRQVISVPIARSVSGLVVKLHPVKGSRGLRNARLVAGCVGAEGVSRHAAYGRPYTSDLPARRTYDDDGRKLTDGVIPASGFGEGRSVGWTVPEAAISFDLGAARRVTAVEVVCQGGSAAWVNWPVDAVAFAGMEPTPVTMASTGAWPVGTRWFRSGPVSVLRSRSATDKDGVLRFDPREPVRARHVGLVLRGTGWIMVSEVRILDGGRNLAREAGVGYSLRPLPTAASDEANRYADDGCRLTDGVVARTFASAEVAGWSDGRMRSFVVDLGSSRRISAVTAWSLRGGQHGIYAPREVVFEGSADGRAWQALGRAASAAGDEDGRSTEAAPYRVECGVNVAVRYVRVRVLPARGWAMVSEIEVHAR